MGEGQADGSTDVVTGLYAVGCFVAITTLTLAEQAAQLPGAVVASAAGWWVMRSGPRPGRPGAAD